MSSIRYERGTKRSIILTIILLVLAIAVIFGVLHYIEEKRAEEIAREEDTLNRDIMVQDRLTYDGKVYSKKKNVKSYLLLGTDLSDQAEENEGFVENGFVSVMADAIYLVVVDNDEQTYGVLQLDRNTIGNVHVLDVTGEDMLQVSAQLCTAYFYGQDHTSGSENVKLSVSELLNDVDIDGYASFTMDSIPVINNMVDGVTVTLESDLTNLDSEMEEGKTLKLTDEQAKLYVQSRMNADDGTNSSRLLRQSGYISALLDQAKEKAKEDGSFVNSVYGRLDEVMTTDFSGDDFATVVNSMLAYENEGIVTIDGTTKKGEILDDGKEHEEFYPDENSITKAMLSLYYKEK